MKCTNEEWYSDLWTWHQEVNKLAEAKWDDGHRVKKKKKMILAQQ